MLDKKQSLNDEIIQSDSWITELSTDELRDLIHWGNIGWSQDPMD